MLRLPNGELSTTAEVLLRELGEVAVQKWEGGRQRELLGQPAGAHVPSHAGKYNMQEYLPALFRWRADTRSAYPAPPDEILRFFNSAHVRSIDLRCGCDEMIDRGVLPLPVFEAASRNRDAL